jgi:hypothetical protein
MNNTDFELRNNQEAYGLHWKFNFLFCLGDLNSVLSLLLKIHFLGH